MVVVAGPRIDPATLPTHDGLEMRAYVHDLYRQLAACDLAVVQGGLTTSMELTANRRPFLYFPLRHHFEQNFHVRTASIATAPDGGWTSRPTARTRSPPRSPRRSGARSTTAGRDRRRGAGRRADRRAALACRATARPRGVVRRRTTGYGAELARIAAASGEGVAERVGTSGSRPQKALRRDSVLSFQSCSWPR